MMKSFKRILAALCCVGVLVCVPACRKNKDGNGKVVKETKYKKEKKVKSEKHPKKVKKTYVEESSSGSY